jgi:hypothetical protein
VSPALVASAFTEFFRGWQGLECCTEPEFVPELEDSNESTEEPPTQIENS